MHPNYGEETPFDFVPRKASEEKGVRVLRGKRRQLARRALSELSEKCPEDLLIELKTLYGAEAIGLSSHGTRSVISKERSQSHFTVLKATEFEAKHQNTIGRVTDGALYDENHVLAYAMTRLPGCFAAIERVFREIQMSAPPTWRPQSLLDFGAGPATGAWAAHHVWYSNDRIDIDTFSRERSDATTKQEDWYHGSTLREMQQDRKVEAQDAFERFRRERLRVTAVEPSNHMVWLGQQLMMEARTGHSKLQQQTRDFDLADQNSLHNRDRDSFENFPDIYWTPRLSYDVNRDSDKRYDVVLAAYVLGEISDEVARRKIIRRLWQRTGRYLVLIEPGTPSGFYNIHNARSYVLSLSNTEDNKKSSGSGAHVVAPCPHDGPCPLLLQQSWCHFKQKFQISGLHKAMKASMVRASLEAEDQRPRNINHIKSHQDERFSFVVLARGARKPHALDEWIPISKETGSDAPSRDLRVDGEEDASPGGSRRTPKKHSTREGATPHQHQAVTVDDAREEIMNSIEEMRQLLKDAEGKSESEGGMSESSKVAIVELIQDMEEELDLMMEEQAEARRKTPVAAKRRSPPTPGDQHEEACILDSDSEENRIIAPVMMGSARGIPYVVELDRPDPREEEDAETASEGDEESDVFEEDSIDQSHGGSGTGTRLGDEVLPLQSLGWSRLIRTPRKRGGHVILDLCSGHDVDGVSLGGKRGMIVQQVVSKAASLRETMSLDAYRLARKLPWGERWPLLYQIALGSKK